MSGEDELDRRLARTNAKAWSRSLAESV